MQKQSSAYLRRIAKHCGANFAVRFYAETLKTPQFFGLSGIKVALQDTKYKISVVLLMKIRKLYENIRGVLIRLPDVLYFKGQFFICDPVSFYFIEKQMSFIFQ